MKITEKNHVTELLFSVALLCVFLITGVLVIMTGANVYRNTVRNSDRNYHLQTSLSYITEKIRQNDSGGVSLGETDDGVPALLLSSQYQDTAYITYIYACDREMRELFVRQGLPADSSDGTALLQINSLEFEKTDEDLLQITVSDTEGNTFSTLIHPSAEPDANASQTETAEEGGGL